jgi:hypothetical protein
MITRWLATAHGVVARWYDPACLGWEGRGGLLHIIYAYACTTQHLYECGVCVYVWKSDSASTEVNTHSPIVRATLLFSCALASRRVDVYPFPAGILCVRV